MKRRLFLKFLSLPVVMPLAASAQRLYAKLRKPSWSLTIDGSSAAPFVLEVVEDGRTTNHIVIPASRERRRIDIPVYSAMPAKFTVKFHSEAKTPFKLWAYGYTVPKEDTCPWPS